MLVPHLHLCNRAVFRDNAANSGKPGHNRDIGPNSGTVPAKPGHLATMYIGPRESRLAVNLGDRFSYNLMLIRIYLGWYDLRS